MTSKQKACSTKDGKQRNTVRACWLLLQSLCCQQNYALHIHRRQGNISALYAPTSRDSVLSLQTALIPAQSRVDTATYDATHPMISRKLQSCRTWGVQHPTASLACASHYHNNMSTRKYKKSARINHQQVYHRPTSWVATAPQGKPISPCYQVHQLTDCHCEMLRLRTTNRKGTGTLAYGELNKREGTVPVQCS